MSNSNAMSRVTAELLAQQGILLCSDVGLQNAYRHIVMGLDTLSECPSDDRRKILRTSRMMIASAIQATRAHGRKIGIYGQAPSDYPDFAQFLVEQGIDSISLNPDAVLKTTIAILEMEKQL